MATNNPRQVLDLRGTSCPMAFVKTRMFLDKLPDGELVSVVFEDTPTNEPLVRSISALGHLIMAKTATQTPAILGPAATNAPCPHPVNTLQLITIDVQVKK